MADTQENIANETLNEELPEETPENPAGTEAQEKTLTPEEEIKDLIDRNLRLLAEMQNLRARHQKDLQATREYAVSGFANDMVNLSENIYRAREAIPAAEDEVYKKILHGLDLTIEELKKVFTKHGIERVAPNAGDKFNYALHQAVVQVPTNEFEEGCIVNLITAGYSLKERLLKPALVAVAKKVADVQPITQPEAGE